MSVTKASEPIGSPPGGRKLIAVVYVDMVGYSRLIGLDDTGTLERLRTLRSTLIDPAIAERGGRIVSTGGDSLLIVFDSIDGAVRCTMKVQQQVPVCDGEQPPNRAIRLRVGINVGDVIPDGSDVHGDVVNVAARLQAECPAGDICVSRAVRDHMQDRIDLSFEELGPLKLKNIARPVDAFVLPLHRNKKTHIPKSTLPHGRIDLNVQQLHVFYRVAKLGSIPRAAEELCVTQSSIAGQLLEFEQRCGVALLHRLSAGVALTDAGHLALDHAERIFNQAGELRSMLEDFPGARAGKLTVGGSLTAGEFFLPNAARRFREHNRDVALTILVDNSSVVLGKITQAELDLGFVGTDAIPADLTAIPCWEDEVVVIALPNSATHIFPNVQLVQSQQFVMREPGSATRQHIEQYLQRRGLTVQTAMNVGSPEAVKRYVAAGVGWGFASKHSVMTEVASGQLAIVRIEGWDCRRVFYAVHRKGYRLSISQTEFIKLAQTLDL